MSGGDSDDSDFHTPSSDSKLYSATLALAIEDLFNSPTAVSDRAAKIRAREESRRLLTDETGEWAEHREWLCAMAGLNPVALRERVLARLEREAPEPIHEPDPEVERARKREAARRRAVRQKAAREALAIVSLPMADAAE